MAHFIQEVNDRSVCVTLSGVMDHADRAAIERAARAMIAEVGTIHVLIILKDFEGFARGVNWGDLEFYAEHADDIAKMAIVGDPKWKADALAFTGSGTRKTEIRFFPMTSFGEANAWITSS